MATVPDLFSRTVLGERQEGTGEDSMSKGQNSRITAEKSRRQDAVAVESERSKQVHFSFC